MRATSASIRARALLPALRGSNIAYKQSQSIHSFTKKDLAKPLRDIALNSEPPSAPSAPAPLPPHEEPETVFYEGSGAPAELAISLALSVFILTIPLTVASVGRRLWIKYKFTNKRVIVVTDSPTTKRTVEVAYSKIREVRTASRAFGLWGDMVIILKDGARLEIAGLERHKEIQLYIEGFIKP